MTTFSDELVRAMTARGMSARELARRTGTDDTAISHWRKGTRIPPLAAADRMADVLESDEIRRRVVAALSRRCARCRRRFLADARHRAQTRYCGKACRMAVHRARANRTEVAQSKLRTARLEKAIAAHCNDCEPLGLCRNSECHLRSVSPLPFVPLVRVVATRKEKEAA